MTRAENARAGIELVNQIPPAKRVLDELGPDGDFEGWFSREADLLRSDIGTAIHESIHMIRDSKGFMLIDGRFIADVQNYDNEIPKPKDIVAPMLRSKYAEDDYFVGYIESSDEAPASSADFFSYMLDELNAYAHDLNVFIHPKLDHLTINTNPRDGTVAFMLFILAYLNAKPQLNGEQRNALGVLWNQSEQVLQQSASFENISTSSHLYAADMRPLLDTIEPYIGRAAKDVSGFVNGEFDPGPGSPSVT